MIGPKIVNMTDFKRCRVCLVRGSDSALSSLRENGGERAMFFEKFFGISLMNNTQEALICDNCLVTVAKLRLFIDNARHWESTYFEAARFLSTCGSDDDAPRVCRCCLSTSHLRLISKSGPDFVQSLLLLTGIDVRADQTKVFICSKCKLKLRQAESLDSTVNENQRLHFEKGEEIPKQEKIPIKATPQEKSASDPTSFHCKICRKDYATQLKLRRHNENIHTRKKEINCNFCEYSSCVFINFIEHISNHLNPPNRTWKRVAQKNYRKYEDSEVSLTCPTCKEELKSVKSLERHFAKKHIANMEYSCDHCGYRTYKKHMLTDHITCKHLIKSHRDMYDKDRKFECTFEGCHKRFKVLSLLKQHMDYTHSGIRYTCWWCQKSYNRQTYLNRHQKTCSGVAKASLNVPKPIEDQKYLDTKTPKIEIRATEVIEPQKPKKPETKFKCSECLKSYSTASNLKLHVQNIHEKKVRFSCNFCDSQTFFITNFLRHVATHLDRPAGAENSEKVLEPKKEEFFVSLTCQVCSESFENIRGLKQHYMKKHQARRKFECDYCGWRSVYKKDLGNHITCKHLIQSIHDMFDTERRFRCTFENCHKRFKLHTLLRQHLTRTHSGIRYTCWWCQKSYCRNFLLKKHQAKCLPPGAIIKTEP